MIEAASYYDDRTATNGSSAVEASDGFKRLNSPLPFLFGGLGLMLALIAAALIILACSHCQDDSSEDTSGADEEKNPEKLQVRSSSEEEPRIVVIMAGDELPTYLARPRPVVASSSGCMEQTGEQISAA
ncbi:hypothetical protein SAY87_032408 [Trapa incisa]|uniref:Uncharacterized protein n=1 Tax=Trapa incisa TaxID=236973 RepID=A0AAN7GC21_9MYRT|nr:hypothetical protein SAY87_032408 [Trapa incisa]